MAYFRHRILYEKGVIPQLAKRFNVSENTVRYALRFATEGEQPDLIRKVALEEYGCALWKIQCKLPPKTKRFCPLVLK